MSFRTNTITLLPALFLFMLSSYVAFLTFQMADPSKEKMLLLMATSLFLGGVILTVCWGYYWVIRRRLQNNWGTSHGNKAHRDSSHPHARKRVFKVRRLSWILGTPSRKRFYPARMPNLPKSIGVYDGNVRLLMRAQNTWLCSFSVFTNTCLFTRHFCFLCHTNSKYFAIYRL